MSDWCEVIVNCSFDVNDRHIEYDADDLPPLGVYYLIPKGKVWSHDRLAGSAMGLVLELEERLHQFDAKHRPGVRRQVLIVEDDE